MGTNIPEMKQRFTEIDSLVSSMGPGAAFPTLTPSKHKVKHQRTTSSDTLFPFYRYELRKKRMPEFWLDFMSRQDLGATFITEDSRMKSNYSDFALQGTYFGQNWSYSINGPLWLTGFANPLDLMSSDAVNADNVTLFALGGHAIKMTRPGKPTADIATMLGELKKDGIPSIIGSLWARSKSFKELARESGNEYLNAQFGWAPLIRDLESVCSVVTSTRKLLEAHEKQLNKLLQRTYHYDTVVQVNEGMSKSRANYEITPSQQGGLFSYMRTGTSLNSQVPIEIERSVTKSHFSGAYRFFYPDVAESLKDLAEFESQANSLLGTRLDPEVLWNLAPWTWLIDWFISFGDVVGNISAIVADGLVIQYAYIMQETRVHREVTLPKGIQYRNSSNNSVWTGKPYLWESDYVRKRRAKASPFGFGLTSEMFTPQQWAILAALGISHGLK